MLAVAASEQVYKQLPADVVIAAYKSFIQVFCDMPGIPQRQIQAAAKQVVQIWHCDGIKPACRAPVDLAQTRTGFCHVAS